MRPIEELRADFIAANLTAGGCIEAREIFEEMADELAALREQTRVRDARKEPPHLDDIGESATVLVFDLDGWRSDYAVSEEGYVSWDASGDMGRHPFWLPMPPVPKEKP